MRHTGLEEAQTGIKIAGRNINNLIYADDTTLMAESEEELKSLLRPKYWSFSFGIIPSKEKNNSTVSFSLATYMHVFISY